MLRPLWTLLICGFAFAPLAALDARADDYRDLENGFRVTVPAGWSAMKAALQGIALVMISPRIAETGGNCNVVAAASTETKNMSQDELNAMLDQSINDAFWGQVLSAAHIANPVIETSGNEMRSGRKIFFVLVHFSVDAGGGKTIKLTAKQVLHSIPGRIHFVTCMGREEAYGVEEKDIESVFASFEPSNDSLIAGLRTAPAGLRLAPRRLSNEALWQLTASGARGVASARR